MEKVLDNEKALVVFSGGQDSTTCMFWALDRYAEVELATFNYGQRHALEIDIAKQIAQEQGLKHHILDMSLLSQLSPNALTNHDLEITHDDVPNTFVPARNLLFMSFAAALAYQIKAKHIVTGVCETDFSGYPDCRDNFIKSLNVTINLSMDMNFEIHTPLMWLDKKETWALADKLGQLDYVNHQTLTCYEGIPAQGCGVCPSCLLRNNGLNSYLEEKNSKEQK